jgi:hypothetical protein
MALFDIANPEAALGYRNIRVASPSSDLARIREGLEALWFRYEPYADTNFCEEFSKQPDTRFWEMYLTVRFLDARKKLRPRAELTAADRDTGPDICIRKSRRHIWIEAIAPTQGDAKDNLDRVPDLLPAGPDELKDPPRREVELRITSALLEKADKFQGYREKGIVGENDSCIVAISAGQFALQAAGAGLPHAVTAAYPFGDEYFVIDPRTHKAVDRRFLHSGEIKRVDDDPISRSAFQHERFSGVSGLIWSRRSIGNFLGQQDDFVFIHNQVAQKPIPRKWIRWPEEYFPINEGRQLKIKRRRK